MYVEFLAVLDALVAEEAQALLLALLQPENGDLHVRHLRARNIVVHCMEPATGYDHCDGGEIRSLREEVNY